jgi:hypothetical protein
VTPSGKAFPFPLPLDALRAFFHPLRGHVYADAQWHEGEALACNGWVALRAGKGRWVPGDFGPAPEAYLTRFFEMPWGSVPTGKDWGLLDDVRGLLFRYEPRGVFATGGKLAPCAGVRVGGVAIIPLSLLQLVSRLPRCEVWTGGLDPEVPLPLRFSGGVGLIWRGRFTEAKFSIFEPRRHEDGTRAGKDGPRPNLGLPGWPPVDETNA